MHGIFPLLQEQLFLLDHEIPDLFEEGKGLVGHILSIILLTDIFQVLIAALHILLFSVPQLVLLDKGPSFWRYLRNLRLPPFLELWLVLDRLVFNYRPALPYGWTIDKLIHVEH